MDVGSGKNPELSTLSIFKTWPSQVVQSIQERAVRHEYDAGKRIIEEGAAADSMFFLAQGSVRVERGGTREHLSTVHAPSLFGEMALVAETKRLATVITDAPCVLIEVTRDAIFAASQSFPGIAEEILAHYRQRLLTNVLGSSPLFEPLPEESRAQMVQSFASQSVTPGQVLISEGQPGSGLFVVLRGSCEVVKAGHNGEEVMLGRLGEGDIFGEISLVLFDQLCTATVRGREDGVVLFLNREVFQSALMSNADVRSAVMKTALARVRGLAEMGEDIGV